MVPEINKYVEKRYSSWLDYSRFQCSKANMESEANDVLDEVLLSLLQKDERKLKRLYDTLKGEYREIDYYVLRMIKLNVYSPTSPYQSKCRFIPNANVDVKRLKIACPCNEGEDAGDDVFVNYNKIRETVNTLNLSDRAKRVFEHRFIHGLPFDEWQGNETKAQLYMTYHRVVLLIRRRIKGQLLI